MGACNSSPLGPEPIGIRLSAMSLDVTSGHELAYLLSGVKDFDYWLTSTPNSFDVVEIH